MIDTKKEQERDELHRAIWAIADELRGAVDGWDFKNYVLGTMFYRYISENLCSYINNGEIEAGTPDFDYAEMPDDEAEEARDGLVEEKGCVVLGARPVKAARVELPAELAEKLAAGKASAEELKAAASEISDQFTYGSNMRGSAEYRHHLGRVLLRRCMEEIQKKEEQ